MLELAGVPFVGSGVLASALCMDKLKCKDVLAVHGIPQVPWVGLRDTEQSDAERRVDEAGLRYPLFVKPANLGSSVGVSRALDASELAAAVAHAAEYDEWIVVEESAARPRDRDRRARQRRRRARPCRARSCPDTSSTTTRTSTSMSPPT